MGEELFDLKNSGRPAKRAKTTGEPLQKQRYNTSDEPQNSAILISTQPAHDPFFSSDDDGENGPTIATPNDTVLTLALLKSQFPKVPGVTPFSTKTQIYTVLNDKTLADRELDELIHSNEVRLFKLPSGPEDYAVMPTGEYAAAVRACAAAVAAKGPALTAAFDWLIDRVLPQCCDVSVTHTELLRLLGFRSSGPGSQASDAHVALLLQSCCLTRYTGTGDGPAAPDCYHFAMPGAGPAVRSISAGRREILDALNRRQHPEMLEKELEKRKLRSSVMGVQWHLRELLGSGAVLRLETTVGPLIRVAKRG